MNKITEGKDKGQIYFIRTGKLTKIGKTKDVWKRLPAIKVGNPYAFLSRFYDISNYEVIEKGLHNIFQKKRHHGEWFRLSIKDYERADKYIMNNTEIFDFSEYEYGHQGDFEGLREHNQILHQHNLALIEEVKVCREMIEELDTQNTGLLKYRLKYDKDGKTL